MARNHNAIQLTELTDAELRAHYAYPPSPPRPWVRANFVSSIDGAVSSGGTSAGLGTPADRRVFTALRELADVVLVGAGTVRAENYGGAHTDPVLRQELWAQGNGGHPQGAPPPIAVVTAHAALDPAARLFTDSRRLGGTPPLLITTAAAPSSRLQQFTDAGAEVIVAGDTTVRPEALLAALQHRGKVRVLCEGGPHLFGDLLAADLLDELCLTTAPLLVGGKMGRISLSEEPVHSMMRRAGILLADDGTMLTRWVRARNPTESRQAEAGSGG